MAYTDTFGGGAIYPSDVSYLAISLSANIALAWPLENSGSPYPAARVIDVNPTGAGFTISLPDATLAAPGETILFNNVSGSQSFTVTDAMGNAIATVPFGTQWQVYLASNISTAGLWRVFRYGASTATIQPSTLAGFGLTVTGATLSQAAPVSTFSTSGLTVSTANRAGLFVWTGTGSGILNLPTVANAANNFFVMVRNAGGGNLTIDPAGAETVNGGSALVLMPGDSVIVVCDGSTWYTVGFGQSAVFAFDYTAINVAPGGTYTLSGSELNRIAYKFTGTLTSNVTIVIPATIQQYWITNATTGAFTLGVKTATGAATFVNQGAHGIYYCDGLNVILASDPTTLTVPIDVSDGGTGATTPSAARLNLGITPFADTIVTATTGASVRTTIGAAASGANTDITSMATVSITALTAGTLTVTGTTGFNGAVTFNGAANLLGAINLGPTVNTGQGASTGDCTFELGGLRTGSGNAYFDFHSTSGTDFEARIIRATGADGELDIIQSGSGQFVLQTGTGPLVAIQNGFERFRVHTNGYVGVNWGTPTAPLHVAGDAKVGYLSAPETYNMAIHGRSPAGGTVDWDFVTTDATNGVRTSATLTSDGILLLGTTTHPAGGKLMTEGGRIYSSIADFTQLGLRYGSANGFYYLGATNSTTPDLGFFNAGGGEAARFTTNYRLGVGKSDGNAPLGTIHAYNDGSIPGLSNETSAARGGGNCFNAWYDPSGRKGYQGFSGDNHLRILNEIAGGFLYLGSNGAFPFSISATLVNSDLPFQVSAATGVVAKVNFGNPVNSWSLQTGTTANEFKLVDNQFSNTRLYFDSYGCKLQGSGQIGARLEVYQPTAQSSVPSALFYSNAGAVGIQNAAGLQFYHNMSAGLQETTVVYGNTANSFLSFGHFNGSAYNERMRIDNNGSLLVGATSAPSSTKAYVKGGRSRFEDATQPYAVGVSYGPGLGACYVGASNSATPDMIFSNDPGGQMARMLNNGGLLVSGTGGLGYDTGTGTGGTVTQTGSRTNPVTLNKLSGTITLVNAVSSSSWTFMTVVNSTVAANDVVVVVPKYTNTVVTYQTVVQSVGNGSFVFGFAGIAGSGTAEAPQFNFVVIKGAAN